MFLHYINTKQKHIKVFFLPNANKYPHQIFSTSTPLAHSPHPLHCSFSTSVHPLIYSIRQRRENAHETVSISASPSTVPAFKFKFLYYAPQYGVFQALKRKLTLRNMNGSLYCCYQNSPYQFCPHILVFMFKNYITHRHTHTDTHTHTHTHNMYIITRIFTIILMFTYENKKYTRSSKLIM